MRKSYDSVVILHDIRSVHNVGAIFRTADAIGVSKIYLTGYTPTPLDRFGRVRSDVSKSALGAERNVAWEHFKKAEDVLEKLMEDGFELIGVEQSKSSIDYKNFKHKQNTAFLFGNEVYGIPTALLKKCDNVIDIPMIGKKESLNVSVAVGIVLFRILDSG